MWSEQWCIVHKTYLANIISTNVKVIRCDFSFDFFSKTTTLDSTNFEIVRSFLFRFLTFKINLTREYYQNWRHDAENVLRIQNDSGETTEMDLCNYMRVIETLSRDLLMMINF